MTISQQTSFLSEILKGDPIPVGKLAYFRERLRNRLYEFVAKEFLERQEREGLTRADVARRIRRRPEQVTRWLGAPGNWTLDTLSDLMVAMALEPEFSAASLDANRAKSSPNSLGFAALQAANQQERAAQPLSQETVGRSPWQPSEERTPSLGYGVKAQVINLADQLRAA